MNTSFELGGQSPWGKIQDSTQIKRGVRYVTTAGHGGYMISNGVAVKELSINARELGMKWGNYICFEEDCDWAIIAYEHPEWHMPLRSKLPEKPVEEILADIKQEAKKLIEDWNATYFEVFKPEEIKPPFKSLKPGYILTNKFVINSDRLDKFEVIERYNQNSWLVRRGTQLMRYTIGNYNNTLVKIEDNEGNVIYTKKPDKYSF